jgi:lactam utilization protein B
MLIVQIRRITVEKMMEMMKIDRVAREGKVVQIQIMSILIEGKSKDMMTLLKQNLRRKQEKSKIF